MNPIAKGIKNIGNIAAIFGFISIATGVYIFYRENVWVPKVSIDSIDWNNGFATVSIGEKKIKLFGDTKVFAGGNWSVRFSKEPDYNGKGYSRIELLKDERVYKILKEA